MSTAYRCVASIQGLERGRLYPVDNLGTSDHPFYVVHTPHGPLTFDSLSHRLVSVGHNDPAMLLERGEYAIQ